MWPKTVLSSTVVEALYQPILAPLLKNRAICAAIAGATTLHLSLVVAGWPSWRSPVHDILGIPDPGCGLSRAILALLWGDWRTALMFHAFAPLFLIALALIGLNAILPGWPRDKLAAWVEGVERRTGLTAMLLIGLIIYWLARLFILREAFINLIAG